MIFTARLIEAAEALSIGLVSEVIAKEDLARRGMALATRIAGHAPLTLYATKEGLRRVRVGEGVSDRDLVRLCYGSGDFREGMDAFLTKRAAHWQGR